MLLKETAASRARLSITALMWSIIRDLGGKSISPSSAKLAKAFATGLGFPVTFQESSSARPLPYHSVLDRANKPLDLPPATIDFQLNHCGPFLERSFDPAPDARVSGFHPDAWQRRVLDAIDADKSTFVGMYSFSCLTFPFAPPRALSTCWGDLSGAGISFLGQSSVG